MGLCMPLTKTIKQTEQQDEGTTVSDGITFYEQKRADGTPDGMQKRSDGKGDLSKEELRKERIHRILEDPPTKEQLEIELHRVRGIRKGFEALRGILMAVITAAAAAALAATLFLPILRIYGTSMMPTLDEHDVVMAVKTDKISQGELVAFYFNNKILVKRVIAGPGQWVDIDSDGNVSVDGRVLDEPYLQTKSKGTTTDINYPYQVPDGKYFVMGDHREVSVDSRNSEIGCVGKDQLVGRIVFRIWPLQHLGPVK